MKSEIIFRDFPYIWLRILSLSVYFRCLQPESEFNSSDLFFWTSFQSNSCRFAARALRPRKLLSLQNCFAARAFHPAYDRASRWILAKSLRSQSNPDPRKPSNPCNLDSRKPPFTLANSPAARVEWKKFRIEKSELRRRSRNENKTISQIKSYESNFKTILMNELRRTSNQMFRTLCCDDCGILCDDERYEYQEMKRSLLKKLCTTLFRRKILSNESKKRCWDTCFMRVSSSSSSEFFWKGILAANPHYRSHFAQSHHSYHQNDS